MENKKSKIKRLGVINYIKGGWNQNVTYQYKFDVANGIEGFLADTALSLCIINEVKEEEEQKQPNKAKDKNKYLSKEFCKKQAMSFICLEFKKELSKYIDKTMKIT